MKENELSSNLKSSYLYCMIYTVYFFHIFLYIKFYYDAYIYIWPLSNVGLGT